jgi:hypothetical protein
MNESELAAFESQLASLAPRTCLNRDQLMFAAGQRAGERWLRTINRLLAASIISLASLLLSVVIARSPAVVRPSEVAAQATSLAAPQVAASTSPRSDLNESAEVSVASRGVSHMQLMQMLQNNPDSLPEASFDSAPRFRSSTHLPTSTSRELLLQYLGPASKKL